MKKSFITLEPGQTEDLYNANQCSNSSSERRHLSALLKAITGRDEYLKGLSVHRGIVVEKRTPEQEILGHEQETLSSQYWARGYKTFFMLSSAKTKIYPAHKC